MTGDRVSEVTHFVFIPQTFLRRYQEMRSANNTIANVAGLTAGLLYGIGGCVCHIVLIPHCQPRSLRQCPASAIFFDAGVVRRRPFISLPILLTQQSA